MINSIRDKSKRSSRNSVKHINQNPTEYAIQYDALRTRACLNLGILKSELELKPYSEFTKNGVPSEIAQIKYQQHKQLVKNNLRDIIKEEQFLIVAMKSKFKMEPSSNRGNINSYQTLNRYTPSY